MRSYEEILQSMFDRFEEKTGNQPDKASDIGIRMEVLAGEIFSVQTEIVWLKNQIFPHTATGEYLNLHARERGIERKRGTKSSGEVTFYLAELLSYDVTVPKGTVCASTGENSARFETTEEVTIKSGRLATNAPVQALTEGENGNAAKQEITVLVTPVPGVDHILNDYKLENGSDAESDESLRKRVLDSYVNISNGTNKAFYIKSALEIEGVTAAGVVPRNRGMGTVDVFIMTADGAPSAAMIKKVKNHLDSLREINVDIEVKPLGRSTVNVYVCISVKNGYDFNTVRQECTSAINKYFAELGAGENVYLSDIGEYLQHVEGVKNYSFESHFTNDTEISEDSIAVPNSISITERVER